jgi:hypothetical protein
MAFDRPRPRIEGFPLNKEVLWAHCLQIAGSDPGRTVRSVAAQNMRKAKECGSLHKTELVVGGSPLRIRVGDRGT